MSDVSASQGEFFPVEQPGEEAAEPTRPRQSTLLGLLVGGSAALAISGLLLWAGRTWDSAVPAQLIADRATIILPLDAFERALAELETDAKATMLVSLTLVQVLVGGLLGLLYARVAKSGAGNRVLGGLALATVMWVLLSLVAAPLGNIGVLGVDAVGGFAITQAVFILASLLFGFLTAFFVPWPTLSIADQPESASRRNLVRLGGVAALVLPALLSTWYVGRRAQQLRTSFDAGLAVQGESDEDQTPADPNDPFSTPGMQAPITPLDAFYVVSKNFTDPTVDGDDWTLTIEGLVERPMTLSYTDIQLREATEFTSTLECISNKIGGSFISNGVWTGFPLAELLDEAGLKPGVVDIELEAADGYIESIPLAEALAPDTMLVHTINGEPLNDKHGFPLRLIVPGIFGMKNVKWITAIRAVDIDVQGYWQERGWSDIATVVTMSRIDIPRDGYQAQLGETVTIGGVAFSGDREISKVEVSLDGGLTWRDALLDERISALSWRLWVYQHETTEPGVVLVAVRATDGTGELQTPEPRGSLPDGATGYHHHWYEVLNAAGQSVEVGGRSAKDVGREWIENPETPG
jgi:DMSO/TMAO reductase YedYZ molybdopterin-dependent catalytic subunit